MNMFKNRRKAKEQPDTFDISSGRQTPLVTHRTVRGLRRKNKHIEEEFKPTLDLSLALPDNEDFRTSLLMPKLSARFSMLREQDDPNTKIGKASDDSVLFPKRASRLNLFGHHALADIDEDDSVYSTVRVPFAERGRSGSLGDGYDSDGGSIMSRARPGEGRDLLSTRFNLPRIPATLARNFSEPDTQANNLRLHDQEMSGPRTVRYRLHEIQDWALSEQDRDSSSATDTRDSIDVASPIPASSHNRATQSSTHSNGGRTSTAATSISSDTAALRSSGADSVRSRYPSPPTASPLIISKNREEAIPNRFASQPKHARPAPIYGDSLRKASSPPLVSLAQPLDFGFDSSFRSSDTIDSPPSEAAPTVISNALAENLEPNDRGKATALGLFNKPAKEFDEDQFNKRQKQMHEDQVSPMNNDSRTTSLASADTRQRRRSSLKAAMGSIVATDSRSSGVQASLAHDSLLSTTIVSKRASKISERNGSVRPRSRSVASSITVGNVKARIESLIRKQNAELSVLENEKLGVKDSVENKENLVQTFFNDDQDDEESDFESSRLHGSRVSSVELDESHIHPAFRNSYRVSDVQYHKSNHTHDSRTRSMAEEAHKEENPTVQISSHDQETPDVGLGGLVKSHLRRDSDKSSLAFRPDSIASPNHIDLQAPFEPSLSSPDENDIAGETLFDEVSTSLEVPPVDEAPPTPTTMMSEVAQRFLTQAIAIKDAAEKERAQNAANLSPEKKVWQEDLEPKHQRSESSETTKERRELSEKMAERRFKIREGLKSGPEREQAQPSARSLPSETTALQPFVQQRSVTDPQSRGMRLPFSPPRNGQYVSAEEYSRGREQVARHAPPPRPAEPYYTNPKLRAAAYARIPDPNSTWQPTLRSRTPPTMAYSARDHREAPRSESRSKSRPRHDANLAIPQKFDTSKERTQPAPSPIEDTFNSFDFDLGSSRSEEQRQSPPPKLVIGLPARPSPRPSPISPQSSSESPVETPRPSPALFPNGRSTPSNGRTTPNSGKNGPVFNRKRSVNKTMISEPTFVSSTSSVPLVHLPDAQQTHAAGSAPPVPGTYSRRRGNTLGDNPILGPSGLALSRSTPLEPVPASPVIADFGSDTNGRKSPSPRKLRKATSDGGNMAAKARQQAAADDYASEMAKNTAIPIFPNRSATSLGVRADGAMF